jgi:hypothetical protein
MNEVESKIISFKDKKVILDNDVAALNGVETKRINEAVKNNQDKFPEGYLLNLSSEEWFDMKSKISTSFGPGGKVKPPVAFTEKGLYMLATILKSSKATETTLAIVEAFAKLRSLTTTFSELNQTADPKKQKKLINRSGEIISDLLDDQLQISDTETTIELNFAVVKLKHTIKRK